MSMIILTIFLLPLLRIVSENMFGCYDLLAILHIKWKNGRWWWVGGWLSEWASAVAGWRWQWQYLLELVVEGFWLNSIWAAKATCVCWTYEYVCGVFHRPYLVVVMEWQSSGRCDICFDRWIHRHVHDVDVEHLQAGMHEFSWVWFDVDANVGGDVLFQFFCGCCCFLLSPLLLLLSHHMFAVGYCSLPGNGNGSGVSVLLLLPLMMMTMVVMVLVQLITIVCCCCCWCCCSWWCFVFLFSWRQ